MVGEKKWQDWMTKIGSWFVDPEVRYFDSSQIAEPDRRSGGFDYKSIAHRTFLHLHIKGGSRLLRLTATAGVIWLLIMFTLTLSDRKDPPGGLILYDPLRLLHS